MFQRRRQAVHPSGSDVGKMSMSPNPTENHPNKSQSFRSSRRFFHFYCSFLALLLVTNASSMLVVSRPITMVDSPSTQKKKEVSLSLLRLPREPTLTPGCSVKFQYANMSLCYLIPYGANFGDELGPAVVRRILEYHFGCSSRDIHVINLKRRDAREKRTCLFALGSIFHFIRTGDHVWGTGINPTYQRSHPQWLHLHAVRGPETAKKMKAWYNITDVPHGDPGMLKYSQL